MVTIRIEPEAAASKMFGAYGTLGVGGSIVESSQTASIAKLEHWYSAGTTNVPATHFIRVVATV